MVETKNLKTDPRKQPLSKPAKCRPLGGYTLSKTQRKTTQKSPTSKRQRKAQEGTQPPSIGSTDVLTSVESRREVENRRRERKCTDEKKTQSVGQSDGFTLEQNRPLHNYTDGDVG